MDDKALREHVLYLLDGGGAHLDFAAAFEGLAVEKRGSRPGNVPHTPWRLLEHMRLAQRDILEFCRRGDYESPPWPEGYWPEGDAPPSGRAWSQSMRQFRADAKALREMVADGKNDLLEAFAHGQGQTLLREALLAADHNAYHIGQVVVVRRALGAWKD